MLGAVSLGCGGGNNNGDGGKKYPDATVTFDGASDQQGAGGTGNTSGTGGASGAGAADAGAPPIGTGSKLIVAGNITMIGSGQDSCTNQVPPSSDRWCGFARLSADLVDYELWVVDVSKVAEGVTVSCTGGDASCVRLSTGLYVDATNGFRVHGFDGDTLTYEEVPSSSGGGFLGNIFAWRPGWTQPRNLTGNNGLVCNGHALGKAAVCIQNPAPDATQMFVHTAELHAGILDDSNTPLPLIDTIIVVASATEANNGVTKWSARLTPDGKSIAWSTRATDTGTEDLHVQALGSQTKVDVAQDASQWDISADMAKWYWLKAFNYGSSGAPSGTLQTAPFPGGATPVTLAQNVGDFTTAGGGVFYRTQVATATGAGNLLLTADPAVPATVAMIDSSVEFVFGTSPDGKNVTYTKNVQSLASGLFLFDVYVGNSVGNMPCTLTSMPTAFMPPIYLGGGSLVAWGRVNSLTNQLEGVTTSLPGCVTRKFATDIFDWQAVGDEGLVYLDEVNSDPTVDEATLRYGKIAQGVLPSPGNVVQERAGLTFSALLPSLNAVVYPISTHTSADGLYINTMLPFTVTSSVPDGGTTTTDAAPMDTGGGAVDTDAGTSDATPGG